MLLSNRAAFASAPSAISLHVGPKDATHVSAVDFGVESAYSRERKIAAGLFYSWILFSYVMLSRATLALLHCDPLLAVHRIARHHVARDQHVLLATRNVHALVPVRLHHLLRRAALPGRAGGD